MVLGLTTTNEPQLESPEVLRRVDAAAEYVLLETLALSPRCGFASVAAGNRYEVPPRTCSASQSATSAATRSWE